MAIERKVEEQVVENLRDDYPTIQDICKIFKNQGFDVGQCAEGSSTIYRDWHLITFMGDCPDAGLRAFDVAVKHGLMPATPLRLE